MEPARSYVRPHGPTVRTDRTMVLSIPWSQRQAPPHAFPYHGLPSLIGDAFLNDQSRRKTNHQTRPFTWPESLSLFLSFSLYHFSEYFTLELDEIIDGRGPLFIGNEGVSLAPRTGMTWNVWVRLGTREEKEKASFYKKRRWKPVAGKKAGSMGWMGDGSILSIEMEIGWEDGEDGRLANLLNPI
ncbi:hypothetical protein Bca4012_010493 [Brassica carinata]